MLFLVLFFVCSKNLGTIDLSISFVISSINMNKYPKWHLSGKYITGHTTGKASDSYVFCSNKGARPVAGHS